MKKGDLVEVVTNNVVSMWRVVRLDPAFAAQAEEIRIVDKRAEPREEDRPTCPVSKQDNYITRGAG
jgi:hypothetical protein